MMSIEEEKWRENPAPVTGQAAPFSRCHVLKQSWKKPNNKATNKEVIKGYLFAE